MDLKSLMGANQPDRDVHLKLLHLNATLSKAPLMYFGDFDNCVPSPPQQNSDDDMYVMRTSQKVHVTLCSVHFSSASMRLPKPWQICNSDGSSAKGASSEPKTSWFSRMIPCLRP
eukprot:5372954-Amphidinium_carterae.1